MLRVAFRRALTTSRLASADATTSCKSRSLENTTARKKSLNRCFSQRGCRRAGHSECSRRRTDDGTDEQSVRARATKVSALSHENAARLQECASAAGTVVHDGFPSVD